MFTNWLVRRFIKNPEDTASPAARYAYGRLASMVGILCNLLLFIGKLLAGVFSGSVAIIADAFNNLSDAGSVIVTLVGFRLSGRPADSDHPFGHGRMEYLSAMGVAVLIILAGFELASSAVEKILNPEAAAFSWLTMGILAVAIAVKLWMSLYYRNIGKRIRSEALLASGVDSRNDVLCTALVLISSLISWRTGLVIDGYVGVVVALFVMWSGFTIIKEAISPLLGQKPDPELVDGIAETVLSHEGVVGIHDMIVHDYGPGRIIVSLHAEVPVTQDILQSHDIIDCIEMELMERFHIVSCIHMDPVDTDNPEAIALRELTAEKLAAIDARLLLHDFRVVSGETHTNLLFDVVVPFEYPEQERATLQNRLQQALQEENEQLRVVMKIENQYA